MKTKRYKLPDGSIITTGVPDDAVEVREDRGVTPTVQIWKIGNNLILSDAEKRVAIGNVLTTYGAEREAKGREALKAVRYMLEVWDEVLPDGWRENPNHVQSIFLQVVDPTTHLTQSEDNQ